MNLGYIALLKRKFKKITPSKLTHFWQRNLLFVYQLIISQEQRKTKNVQK